MNLVKMNLYRAFLRPSTWILLGISFLSPIVMTIGSNLFLSWFGGMEGYSVNLIKETATAVGTPALLFALTILISNFANVENRTGYVKNIAGQTARRSDFFLSKLATQAIFVALYLVAAIVAKFLVLVITHANYIVFDGENLVKSLASVLIAYLILNAFATMILTLTTLMRDSTVSLVVGLMICFGAESMISMAAGYMFDKMQLDITLKNYLLYSQIGALGEHMVRPLVIGVIYFAVFAIVGVIVSEKRDAV